MSGILTAFVGGAGGYTTLLSASLTSGNSGVLPNAYGFISGFIGTLANTFTPSGYPLLTITSIVDSTGGGGGVKSYITISGFSTDPGVNFLTSFQWGTDPVVPFAGTYQYTPGTPNIATWTFSTGSNVFGLVAGVSLTKTLVLKGII